MGSTFTLTAYLSPVILVTQMDIVSNVSMAIIQPRNPSKTALRYVTENVTLALMEVLAIAVWHQIILDY